MKESEHIHLLHPRNWNSYELIDAGNFEKLERFGEFILQRPEPQAVWQPSLTESEWSTLRHARFIPQGSHKGHWEKTGLLREQWHLPYETKHLNLQFKLSLTSFKHIGVFPEQAANWDYISYQVNQMKANKPRVLNLFAYTGGASLAAKAAGADVVHVDSVKQVVSWARENMELSGLQDIRWTIEDALKFAQREAKRSNVYNGIILDPPAYGIGANGERWKLEEKIDQLLSVLSEILHPKEHFLLLNTYSLGFSSLIIKNLLNHHFRKARHIECGELALYSKHGKWLPLGVYGRFSSVSKKK
jgi:23S rRNA (cytosine1962-C5)-methyltransferase